MKKNIGLLVLGVLIGIVLSAVMSFIENNRERPLSPELANYGFRAQIVQCDEKRYLGPLVSERIECYKKYLVGEKIQRTVQLLGILGYENISFNEDDHAIRLRKYWANLGGAVTLLRLNLDGEWTVVDVAIE